MSELHRWADAMTKTKRIILELFGPAFFALLPLWASLVFSRSIGNSFGEIVSAILFYYGVGLLACGLQSICYASIMEWQFARGLSPRS